MSSSFTTSSGMSSSESAAHDALAFFGWDADREAEFAPYAARGLLPGRVLRVDRGQCDLITPAGAVRADT
ncbi:ribosome small subunit-dependent GTPase A, partial [Streptomyces sp. NPDC054802]